MTTLQAIDELLSDLQTLDAGMAELTKAREEKRAALLQRLATEGVKTYKGAIGTASYVETKRVQILDPERLMADCERQNIVRYFKVVPEHKEFTPDLQKDIKAGHFAHDAVNVETTHTLQVRFNQ